MDALRTLRIAPSQLRVDEGYSEQQIEWQFSTTPDSLSSFPARLRLAVMKYCLPLQPSSEPS